MLVPDGEAFGQAYHVTVEGYLVFRQGSEVGDLEYIDGITLEGRTVLESSLGIDATVQPHVPSGYDLRVRGCLSHGLSGLPPVALTFTRPNLTQVTKLVNTSPTGCFDYVYPVSTGTWYVQAIWQGNLTLARAVSELFRADVPALRSDCCTSSILPHCQYQDVEVCVCESDNYCCATKWDALCVAEVEDFGCGTCHDSCTPGIAGCREQADKTCVCAKDEYCCLTAWDALCVDEVDAFSCGLCGDGLRGADFGGDAVMDGVREPAPEGQTHEELSTDPLRDGSAAPPGRAF
jgi:hypothetical protein